MEWMEWKETNIEHPQSASSWKLENMQRLMETSSVGAVNFHQCALGLTSPGGSLLKNATQILTNIQSVLENFAGKQCSCPGGMHAQTISGRERGVQISTHAAHDPPAMVHLLVSACVSCHYLGSWK